MIPLLRSLAKLPCVASIAVALAAVPSVQGAITGTWTGLGNSNSWGTSSNWSVSVSGTFPKSNDTAVFNGDGNGYTTIHTYSGLGIAKVIFDTQNCASYTIGSTSTDTLSFNTGGGIEVNSTVVNDQTVAANLLIGTGGACHIYNFSSAATLYITGTVGVGTSTASTTFAIMNVGNVSISGIITNASGIYTRNIAVTGSAGQVGTVTLSGQNTYLGTTKVTGGTLLVNGDQSAATGNVTVSGSGTGTNAMTASLGGTGIIGGATTLSGSTAATMATLSAGTMTTTGKLSFASSLTLTSGGNNYVNTIFQIDGITTRGVDYDAIDLGANQWLTYGGKLTLDIGNPLAAGTYDLFNFTDGYKTGDFSSIAITGGLYDGYTFSETSGGSGIWVASQGEETLTLDLATGDLVVVPEPHALALIGLGAGSALMLARRRRGGNK